MKIKFLWYTVAGTFFEPPQISLYMLGKLEVGAELFESSTNLYLNIV